MKAKPYPYIWAWGEMLKSGKSYIQREEANAIRDNAPADAIYYREVPAKWHRFEEVTNAHTREVIHELVRKYNGQAA
jgi:hypothetical protein